jgi:hypothetical protein
MKNDIRAFARLSLRAISHAWRAYVAHAQALHRAQYRAFP